ncbi:hypothetical protein VTO73DRAFT_4237 [Trametes versicolor]
MKSPGQCEGCSAFKFGANRSKAAV